MLGVILNFISNWINVVLLVVGLELIFRLIPTRKPVNILALFGRLLAKLSILIAKIGNFLPENRRK